MVRLEILKVSNGRVRMKHGWLLQSENYERTVDWCCITGCLRIRWVDGNGKTVGKIFRPSPIVSPKRLKSIKLRKEREKRNRRDTDEETNV
jgi:hypothetical protein